MHMPPRQAYEPETKASLRARLLEAMGTWSTPAGALPANVAITWERGMLLPPPDVHVRGNHLDLNNPVLLLLCEL